MADYHRTKGFVISKKDFREADQLFNVYTNDFGKIEVIGRGIRKISSKLRPGIGIFYFSEIEFIQGRHYKTLTDASAIKKFKNIRNDLAKSKIAYQIIDVANSFIHCQEKDEKIFALFEEFFNKLEKEKKHQLFYHCFLWNFFSLLGYQIDLHNCALCRKKLVFGNLSYDIKKGGIICRSCLKGRNVISPEVVKILRFFKNKDWDTISRLKIEKSHINSLDVFLENYNYCN